mmetsp:Transcript_54902/g.97865  ORF Transcript_54902/g.97865 Transcript_54902/m.97865 type:complete len:82 (+) Transcript_54902:49-294(+)
MDFEMYSSVDSTDSAPLAVQEKSVSISRSGKPPTSDGFVPHAAQRIRRLQMTCHVHQLVKAATSGMPFLEIQLSGFVSLPT